MYLIIFWTHHFVSEGLTSVTQVVRTGAGAAGQSHMGRDDLTSIASLRVTFRRITSRICPPRNEPTPGRELNKPVQCSCQREALTGQPLASADMNVLRRAPGL